MSLARNDIARFCVIAPTSYLELFATQSDFHLVLAHLVDTDEQYSEFYFNRPQDDYLIMDNGAFELGESYAPDRLIELATKCGASAIVLPDYPGREAQITIDASSKLIEQVKDAGLDTFFCPQSKRGDWDDFVRGYVWAAGEESIDIIGMSILALPTALPHIPAAYARVVGTEILQRQGLFANHKYHHYLGANAGIALEVPPLLNMNALDSLDSSNPVWHAILGHEYSKNTDSYLPVKKVSMPVQFDYPNTNDFETHRRIQHNLDLTFECFEDR